MVVALNAPRALYGQGLRNGIEPLSGSTFSIHYKSFCVATKIVFVQSAPPCGTLITRIITGSCLRRGFEESVRPSILSMKWAIFVMLRRPNAGLKQNR